MNCHNGSDYLTESINSVINQTYKNWEIIFWDNQSSDNSLKIVETFGDNRIKIYKSSKFESLGKARNNAIAKCNGEFIGFLDTDDIWLKDNFIC